MTLPDATAGSQLASGAFIPAWVGFLDIDGDPVRVTTAGASLTFSSTGDADLDGYTYSAVDPQFITIGDIKAQDGGSETVTCSLSGLVGPNTDLLNALGDKGNWQGRTARLWCVVYDADGDQQGAVWPFYTGRMTSMRILSSPTAQTVQLDIENYLASLRSASGRTYLDQSSFDADDNTAALSIAVANGATKGVEKSARDQLLDNSILGNWFRI